MNFKVPHAAEAALRGGEVGGCPGDHPPLQWPWGQSRQWLWGQGQGQDAGGGSGEVVGMRLSQQEEGCEVMEGLV